MSGKNQYQLPMAAWPTSVGFSSQSNKQYSSIAEIMLNSYKLMVKLKAKMTNTVSRRGKDEIAHSGF
jgi:hypothetical protein